MRLLDTKPGQYPGQADPFILKSGGRYYIYVTGHDAIYAYHSDDLFAGWQYRGPVLEVPGLHAFGRPASSNWTANSICTILWTVRM